MYQCIKQYGSIKTGSFWDVERYIVNSDGERRKVIITNEKNCLLLSITEFENHFVQANKLLTEQEYLQTNEEWFINLSTEEKVSALLMLHEKVRQKMKTEIGGENSFYKGDYYREWLKEIHHAN